jgi:hypothetical protein
LGSFLVNARLSVQILGSESIPGQALADDLRACQPETVKLVHLLAIVVAIGLLVKVAEQMERLNADVGSVDA